MILEFLALALAVRSGPAREGNGELHALCASLRARPRRVGELLGILRRGPGAILLERSLRPNLDPAPDRRMILLPLHEDAVIAAFLGRLADLPIVVEVI